MAVPFVGGHPGGECARASSVHIHLEFELPAGRPTIAHLLNRFVAGPNRWPQGSIGGESHGDHRKSPRPGSRKNRMPPWSSRPSGWETTIRTGGGGNWRQGERFQSGMRIAGESILVAESCERRRHDMMCKGQSLRGKEEPMCRRSRTNSRG